LLFSKTKIACLTMTTALPKSIGDQSLHTAETGAPALTTRGARHQHIGNGRSTPSINSKFALIHAQYELDRALKSRLSCGCDAPLGRRELVSAAPAETF
jgi:hypothetical protein